jgi:hypothetical protein
MQEGRFISHIFFVSSAEHEAGEWGPRGEEKRRAEPAPSFHSGQALSLSKGLAFQPRGFPPRRALGSVAKENLAPRGLAAATQGYRAEQRSARAERCSALHCPNVTRPRASRKCLPRKQEFTVLQSKGGTATPGCAGRRQGACAPGRPKQAHASRRNSRWTIRGSVSRGARGWHSHSLRQAQSLP